MTAPRGKVRNRFMKGGGEPRWKKLCEIERSIINRPAIAMEARQGRDGETRLDPKDDSAGPKDIAQNEADQ